MENSELRNDESLHNVAISYSDADSADADILPKSMDIDSCSRLTRTGTVDIKLISPEKKTFRIWIYLAIKRLFDFFLSFFMIVVLSPLLLTVAVSVKITTPGSIIYKHRRLGYRGKLINVYKFRSMPQDDRPLEEVLTPQQLDQYKMEFKIDNDPRVSKFGEFLRRTSLDELPQLFDVFIGKMSFVGPRPIVYKEAKQYYRKNFRLLLSVKPGITGYWQAYGRNNISYESGQRQAMEIYYTKNRSLFLDLKIIFRTFKAVFLKDGAK